MTYSADSARDISQAILDATADSGNAGELRLEFDKFLDRVEETWIAEWEKAGPHPYETGEYIAHIKKRPNRSRLTKTNLRTGAGIGEVYNDSPVAGFVEYGTSDTEEFAPARRTAAKFIKD